MRRVTQLTVASRFDFIRSEPYLAPPPRSDATLVKISAILFSPDDAPPPAALTEWLARQADIVLTISESDELMAMSLRGRPRVVAFDARTEPEVGVCGVPPPQDATRTRASCPS